MNGELLSVETQLSPKERWRRHLADLGVKVYEIKYPELVHPWAAWVGSKPTTELSASDLTGLCKIISSKRIYFADTKDDALMMVCEANRFPYHDNSQFRK